MEGRMSVPAARLPQDDSGRDSARIPWVSPPVHFCMMYSIKDGVKS